MVFLIVKPCWDCGSAKAVLYVIRIKGKFLVRLWCQPPRRRDGMTGDLSWICLFYRNRISSAFYWSFSIWTELRSVMQIVEIMTNWGTTLFIYQRCWTYMYPYVYRGPLHRPLRCGYFHKHCTSCIHLSLLRQSQSGHLVAQKECHSKAPKPKTLPMVVHSIGEGSMI